MIDKIFTIFFFFFKTYCKITTVIDKIMMTRVNNKDADCSHIMEVATIIASSFTCYSSSSSYFVKLLCACVRYILLFSQQERVQNFNSPTIPQLCSYLLSNVFFFLKCLSKSNSRVDKIKLLHIQHIYFIPLYLFA